MSADTVGTPDSVSDIRAAINEHAAEIDLAVKTGDARLLTVALQAALAGTAGTPGAGNKFVTAADIGVGVQAYDSDLAAIAALTTTSYGRSLLTAAAATNLPGGEIGYDQITSPVTVSSTTEATGTAIITAASHTFDGSPVIAEFFSPRVSADGITVKLSLFEGATEIGVLAAVDSNAADTADIGRPVLARYRFTPSAGAHTYKITAFKSATEDAIVNAGGGGTATYLPAYLRFTKV